MSDAQLLAAVKSALNITGTYQDAALTEYIKEVKEFLSDAGVSETIMQSDAITGIVTRGVSDLWNYGAGGADLSPYFMKRATQLALKGGGSSG
ncbi:MAG: hypothetical protein MJY71_08210 [Bacteroidaceae bacterium]|nr:hypothetical protein [Bacteroidaceae bacterium]